MEPSYMTVRRDKVFTSFRVFSTSSVMTLDPLSAETLGRRWCGD